jgi:hypothetical protein
MNLRQWLSGTPDPIPEEDMRVAVARIVASKVKQRIDRRIRLVHTALNALRINEPKLATDALLDLLGDLQGDQPVQREEAVS